MKRNTLFILLLILGAGIFLIAKSTSALSTPSNLKGKILLQVESKGEAWYVSPADGKRYSMGRPNDAFDLMRQLGVGISNDNLKKIKIANENLTGQDSDGDGLSDMAEDAIGTNKNNKDSDSDGYNDKDEIIGGYNPGGTGKLSLDNNFARSHAGKILLQVEGHGEAWYINPDNYQRYFMGRPGDAFSLMRKLGLGISNNDLSKITPVGLKTGISCSEKIKAGKFIEGVKKYYSVRPAWEVTEAESGCDMWYIGTYATEFASTYNPHDWYYDDVIIKNGVEMTIRRSYIQIPSFRIINGQPVYIMEINNPKRESVVWKGVQGVEYDDIIDDKLGIINDRPAYVAFKGNIDEYKGDTIVKWGDSEIARFKDKVITNPLDDNEDEIIFSTDSVSFLAFDLNDLQTMSDNESGQANNLVNRLTVNVKTGVVTTKQIILSSSVPSCDTLEEGNYDIAKKCLVSGDYDNVFVNYKDKKWGPYIYVSDIVLLNGKLTYTVLVGDKKNILMVEDKQFSDNNYISIGDFRKVGNNLAYVAHKENNKYVVVFKGVESKEYDSGDIWIYDVRGKLVYSVKDQTGEYMVFDGIEQKHYQEIDHFTAGIFNGRFIYKVTDIGNGGFDKKEFLVYEE